MTQLLLYLQDLCQETLTKINDFLEIIENILKFVECTTLTEFLNEFDLSKVEKCEFHLKDASFTEISAVSALVLSKHTQYNQTKKYYINEGEQILQRTYYLRKLLENILPQSKQKQYIKIQHLGWSYSLYLKYKQMLVTEDFIQDILSDIVKDLTGQQDIKTIEEFNEVLGKFLLTYQYIFTRILNKKDNLFCLINIYLVNSCQQPIEMKLEHANPNVFYGISFHQVLNVCQICKNFLVPHGQFIFLDSLDYLKEYIRRLKLQMQQFKSIKDQNMSLTSILNIILVEDLDRYLKNINYICEPQMYGILFCFMLNHDVVFFNQQTIIESIQSSLVYLQKEIQINKLETNTKLPKITQLIQIVSKQIVNFEPIMDKKVDIQQEDNCKKLIKFLETQFDSKVNENSLSTAFNLIYRLYTVLNYDAEETQQLTKIDYLQYLQEHHENIAVQQEQTKIETMITELNEIINDESSSSFM